MSRWQNHLIFETEPSWLIIVYTTNVPAIAL